MEVGVVKVTKRRSEGWNNPFIQPLPFPLKRCLSLHPSSPLSFQEPLGKMDLNTKVCVCSYAHKNRACVACSSLWMLGYNMDILWRFEDQHVNHINYTPWWKHRWSSNKEKSAGFAGNLNHIFLKSCSVDPRVAGMHVLILEELVMGHHCTHCFQRPQQLSHAINCIGISNQVETVAIWDSHLCWNGVVLQLACGLSETQISTVAMTQHW